jgi:hypothetical protein
VCDDVDVFSPRFFACFAIVLVALGCVSKVALKTVRTKASTDFSCKESEVKVVELPDAGPKTYRAQGCGKKATYVCEGWDSYSQEPVCDQK